ncbi:hypothetical protein JKY79_03080 [Candidatus Babeliales bacterium]|nr:hypothetical protein [Candidatus Babeliales bacterium]
MVISRATASLPAAFSALPKNWLGADRTAELDSRVTPPTAIVCVKSVRMPEPWFATLDCLSSVRTPIMDISFSY